MLRILFLIICFSCALTQETTEKELKTNVFRLPNNSEPISYNLTITPTIDSTTNEFIGNVIINIRVKSSTDKLTLNADSLKITEIAVTDYNNSATTKINNNDFMLKSEQLIIHFSDPGFIADRVYIVDIKYSGELRNDMTGFYKTSYTADDGNIKWLAVTRFEPTYARRTFPCYDEPAFKTPFLIQIIRRNNQISLSNMPISNSKPTDNQELFCDEYTSTEPISTYLVAFSVSEFKSKTNNQRINIYTHKDYINQATYISDKADKLLNLMEVYTGIPYPYSKLDFLAVPDSLLNSMGHWGLITFRENYLLITDKSSEKDKEIVTTTVQHELSHQWFSNLVTCSWWNYLWLNQALATLFEYFATEVAEIDWRMGDLFIIEQHQVALINDHRPTHPLTALVNTPDEIIGIFDAITYNKGASVLKMLNHLLNDNDLFRKSLNLYLNTYKYKSVEPTNLWDSFNNVLKDAEYKLGHKLTVGEFMSSWTDQTGYPVVYVEANNDNNILTITQKKYQVDVPKINDTSLWHIGLTYTTEKNKEFKNLQPTIWMKNTENKITIPLINDAGWVLFNLQSTGFYRVNYDLKNWNLLIKELKNNTNNIHVLNRAQLIDDSFNLARAGELAYSIPFNLIRYLEKEDDFIPMYSIMNCMSYLVERLRRCPLTGPQMHVIRFFSKNHITHFLNYYEKANIPV